MATHEFGYWKNGQYVCNNCDIPQKRIGETCGTASDYARGLAEGEAKGLERAAEIVKQQAADALANPNKSISGVLSDTLRDEAAKIRAK